MRRFGFRKKIEVFMALCIFILATMLSTQHGVFAQEVEYKIIDDMESGIGRWWKGDPDTDMEQPEVSLSLENKIVKEGENALRFAVAVNHRIAGKGGEKWLVGWPMIHLDLKPVQDWSAYDYLTFWVYVDTDAPNARITLNCGIANGNTKPKNEWLKLRPPQTERGQWKEVCLPLEEFGIGKRDGVGRIAFHIYEGDYQDGDKINFIIDNIRIKSSDVGVGFIRRLEKIAKPTIIQCEHKKGYSVSEESAPIKVVMQGNVLRKDLKLSLGILKEGKVIQESKVPVTDKTMTLQLNLESLEVGSYEILAELKEGNKVVSSHRSEFSKLSGPFFK